MPELPEVHTTVTGLARVLPGLTITDLWTDYGGPKHVGKEQVKNGAFFARMRKKCAGKKILHVHRRAKNILIDIEGGHTILIHMKMTGHVLYGTYKKVGQKFVAQDKGPLRDDSFNSYIHFVISLSNGKHAALSDARKFAKITLINTNTLHTSKDLSHLGPEPLEDSFTIKEFTTRLSHKPRGKIKTVLMDQTVISGIGNIYSDEILWRAGVHPLSRVAKIPATLLQKMFVATKDVLQHGIDFGGDSMSDYRNIDGTSGSFQAQHNAYRKTGKACTKPRCGGTIERLVVGARSAHFCNKHQKILE